MPALRVDARSVTVLASAKNVGPGITSEAGGGAEVADTRRWHPASRVANKSVATVVIVATLVAACSGGTSARPTPPTSPSPTTSLSVEAQILTAWRAEHTAYAAAVRAMDPRYPALTQTAIDPALRGAVAFITASRAQGIVARGSQDLGSPKVISLTPATDPQTAIVQSCIHDGLVLINGKTGKPVPGLAGQVTWALERTTLRHIEGVGWLVADNVVKQDEKESVCGA